MVLVITSKSNMEFTILVMDSLWVSKFALDLSRILALKEKQE